MDPLDQSALRIHPDGRRVSKKKTLKAPKATAYDARGNLVAADAGGSNQIPRYRTLDPDSGSAPTTKKAKRRREFDDNLDFLDNPQTKPTPPTTSPLFTELPSNDLLNSIHHFASEYYHSQGQLSNESKEWRQRRKARKANSDSEEQQEEVVRRGKTRIRPHEWAEWGLKQDMYRTMDGSALTAIGMLVQTYVGLLLSPEKPAGWDLSEEDEVESEERESEEEVESEEGEEEEEEDPSSGEDGLLGPDDLG